MYTRLPSGITIEVSILVKLIGTPNMRQEPMNSSASPLGPYNTVTPSSLPSKKAFLVRPGHLVSTVCS